jgi:hypothetical protein
MQCNRCKDLEFSIKSKPEGLSTLVSVSHTASVDRPIDTGHSAVKSRTRLYAILAGLGLLVFFVAFHAGATRAYFGDDETMNLYGYWAPPLGKVALANLVFWSKFQRPMGVLYYLPLYDLFGLNPVPFTIVRIAILLLNTLVFYFLARYLLRSQWLALLSTFPIAYHAGMGHLAYEGAFIYDVLCGGFYFAALLYYVHPRRLREPLGVRQACIFLALYICAMDSKEMAVSLPVVVLAYEVLFQKSGKWVRFVPALIAGALSLLFILGKTTGEGAMTAMEAYRPVLSWARFSDANTRYLNTLFYTDRFTMPGVLAMWLLLLYVGLRNGLKRRDPRWLLLFVWVVVTPLPISFISGRGGPEIYIVAAGWAMAAAMGMRSVARIVAAEASRWRIPWRVTVPVTLLACAAAYLHETQHVNQRMLPGFLANGERTREMIRQLRELHLQPAPRSRILYLNDALPDGWGAFFISHLVWGDRSLRIELQRYSHVPESEIAARDYVFDYVNGRLVLRKP